VKRARKGSVLLLLVVFLTSCVGVTPEATPTVSPTPAPTATPTLPPTTTPLPFVQVAGSVGKVTAEFGVHILDREVKVAVDRARKSGAPISLKTSADSCGLTRLEAALLTKKVAAETGVPMYALGPTIMSETGFEEKVVEDGNCVIKQNDQDAPAFCLGQIYGCADIPDWVPCDEKLFPDYCGANRKVVHPWIAYWDLYDARTCLETSARILKGFYNAKGDWFLAIAAYKNIQNPDSSEHMEYVKALMDANGVNLDGTWVAW